MRRRLAREIVVQSLYQMEMTGVDANQAMHTMIQDGRDDDGPALSLGSDELDFVQRLLEGTAKRAAAIDQLLGQYLKGWRMERLSRVDRQILRLGVYEMFYTQDTPPKVIINEAIELAKHFGTEESGKFVNGVLGKMVKELDQIKEQIEV